MPATRPLDSLATVLPAWGALLVVLAGVKAMLLIGRPALVTGAQAASVSWAVVVLTAVAALLGLYLWQRLAFAAPWPLRAPTWLPVLLGGGAGAVFALIDAWAQVGDIHVALPWSVPVYLFGAVVSEVQLHLLPVAVLTFLVSGVALRGGHRLPVFRAVVLLVGLVEPVAGLAVMADPASPGYVAEPAALAAFFLAGYALQVAILEIMRVQGFLAALLTRLSFYAVWHLLWPAVFYGG